MAESAWGFYNKFKTYMADGTIDMDGTAFYMHLATSASNALTATLSVMSEITNECASANGYVTSGKAITGITWGQGASAGEVRFDATATIWSASGGNISNAKFAIIRASSGASVGTGKLVLVSKLSTSQFTITDGNTLTVTPSANGLFELN